MSFTTPDAAFTPYTFMGGKVNGFSANIGWNLGSPSQLTVRVVDDPVNGDVFSPSPLGSPAYFSFGGFTFNGLLQKVEEKRDLSGNPVYEVIVVDPREILEGAQVIVGGYSGGTGGMPNLFNAFGYHEDGGYGNSLANEGGMPWYKVRDAVLDMANSPDAGTYGGALSFAGNTYGLDLGDLPTPPDFYRIGGGVSVSLLEAIAQVCEDGGCDFFVELQATTIKVRTASRYNAPPLGTIGAITDENWGGTVVRSTHGVEVRNELTSAFLVGGEVSTLWQTGAVRQFWGYDIDGNPIFGSAKTLTFTDVDGNEVKVKTEKMSLNAAPVADILGSTSYDCTAFEMQLALANQESWLSYVKAYRTDVAAISGLTSPFASSAPSNNAAMRNDFVNTTPDNASASAASAVASDLQVRSNRFYEFVRGYAEEYLGKKFVVGLPFVMAYQDQETLKVTTSWEVSDGGYLPEDAEPLGMSALNQDQFRAQDSRFRAFVAYANASEADLTNLSAQGTVIEDDVLYVECQVEPKVLATPAPAVVVTLPGVVTSIPADNLGDTSVVGAMLQLRPGDAKRKMKNAPISLKVSPPAWWPTAAAIPLKSNVQTYGPWFAFGAPGKVRVESDPSLNPWTYGGYGAMNDAASCRVQNAVTNMQVSETGTLELAGAPSCGLGDLLKDGGPNVTGIDVQFSVTGGVTTGYRFQTFTQRYGTVPRSMVERQKRLALASVEMRRSLRTAIKDRMAAAQAVGDARRTRRAFNERQVKAGKRETPNDVMMVWSDKDGSTVRSHAMTMNLEEAVYLSNADASGDYQQTALMSMNGLFRPFAVGETNGGVMPSRAVPSVSGDVPTSVTLNPWLSPNDIEVFAYGQSVGDLRPFKTLTAGVDARVVGLRGPAWLVGWGYDINGNRTHTNDDYLFRQDTHKAGPLDPLWDPNRGVWTVHDLHTGRLTADIPPSGEGTLVVTPPQGSSYSLPVYSRWSSKVSSKGEVMAGYVASHNKVFVFAADCAD